MGHEASRAERIRCTYVYSQLVMSIKRLVGPTQREKVYIIG